MVWACLALLLCRVWDFQVIWVYHLWISLYCLSETVLEFRCSCGIEPGSIFPVLAKFCSFIRLITKTHLFKYIDNFTSKNWKISDKKLWYFSYFCSKHRLWSSLEPPRRGGSNEYPQSMFLSRNKENNVYPCKPQFYYIKVGFKGVKVI